MVEKIVGTSRSQYIAMLAWLWIGLTSSIASATETLALDQGTSEYTVGTSLHYLEDPTGKLGIQDVREPSKLSTFTKSTVETPNFGFTESAYWFSIRLESKSAKSSQWLLTVDYPPMDHIDVHIIDSTGKHREFRTGDALPFYSRPVDHPTFIFPVDFEAKESLHVMIRIASTGAVKLPIRAYQPNWFWEQDLPKRIFQGILAGIMVVMTLYNLFVFIALRANVYLLYVLFGTCSIGFQNTLNGFAFQFLWPHSTWLAGHAFLISGTLLGAFLGLFSIKFLALKVWTPKIAKVLNAAALYFGFLCVASFVLPYRFIILLLVPGALLCLPILLVAGLIRLKQGSQEAQYYTLAFVALILGIFAFALSAAGVLPANVFTTQSHQVGVVFQVVLLSLALARKLKLLHDENIAFQTQAAEDLEREVQARTKELEIKTLEAQEASLVALNAMELSEQLRDLAEENAEEAEVARSEALGLRAQAEKQADEIASMSKQKTAFFQNISHELRTPLTLILAPLEFQIKEQPDNKDIQTAAKNARRLLRLVNQLLDFQKLEAGKKVLALEPINAVKFVQLCGDYFSSACVSKNIEFSIFLNNQPLSTAIAEDFAVYVNGNVDALEKVLFNFLSNALKYTPEGGKIDLNVLSWPENVRVSVQDTGPGISQEGKDHLFEVFGQLEEGDGRKYEGTGLGLALTKSLTESMGGKVGVESTLGKGSTFFADLPRAEAPKEYLDLILVDDDAAIRKMIQAVMRLSDIIETVQTVSTTNEVRMVLKERKVRCILSDYVLKGEDGISLLQDMARDFPDTKRALITGHMLEDEVQSAMADGSIHQVFYKPVDNGELLRVLERMVQETKPAVEVKSEQDLEDFQVRDWLVADATPTLPTIATPESDKAVPAPREPEHTILVIDDVDDMRDLLKTSLERNGYHVVTAADGQLGIEAAQKYGPDIIITDWMMPNMDGPTFIQTVRTHETLKSTPIVLLTAKSDEESKLTSVNIGADAFLGKPFNDPELTSTVRNLLRLKEQEAQAIRQSTYLGGILDSMTAGIILLTPEATIEDTNESIAAHFGRSSESMVGMKIVDLITSGDMLQIIGIQSLLEGKEATNVSFKHGDTAVTLQVESKALKDKHDEITGYVLTLHDQKELREFMRQESVQLAEVSEIKGELEQQTTELRNALKLLSQQQGKLVRAEKLASLGSMVAGVAHEINTPIGVSLTATTHILPQAHKLIEQINTNKLSKTDLMAFIRDSSEGLPIIESNLSRAAELIHRFKQVSADSSDIRKKEIDIGVYLKEVLESLDSSLASTPHKIEFKDTPNPVMLNLEPVSLAQVIKNLVVNATTHAFDRETGVSGKISLSIEPAHEWTKIVVRDDGNGIASDHLDKIFEPFFTTSTSGERPGLGLNIAQSLVTQRLGGSIECHSTLGQGTEFVITLPPPSNP